LLAKHQAFTTEAGAALVRTLACETLDQSMDDQQLRQAWQQLDARERNDPWVVARAARVAVRLGLAPLGARWLRPQWEQSTELSADERAQLAAAMMDCVAGLSADWLPLMEQRLQLHGREPAVVALVGWVYAERQLWGKAKPLLLQTAAAETLAAPMRRRALRALARMSRATGDEAQAVAQERRAAELD
jgi:HemY protein